ncbi:MAG: TlpA disulfide reductase family protein [Pseudoruegeria sp.]
MRVLRYAVLYTALAFGAIPAFADMSDIEALREGDMKKLVFHSEAKPLSEEAFTDEDGNKFTFADYQGKVLLVNFWATWCAPCRHEMPSLDQLQAELGGDTFEVVPIATGRNPQPALKKFFAEAEIKHLPILLDPKQTLARDMAVLGLPITLIVDTEGREIARLRGDAEWNSESAIAILKALSEE